MTLEELLEAVSGEWWADSDGNRMWFVPIVTAEQDVGDLLEEVAET